MTNHFFNAAFFNQLPILTNRPIPKFNYFNQLPIFTNSPVLKFNHFNQKMIATLDRTKAPALGNVKDLHLQKPELGHLDNGIPTAIFNGGEQEVVMLKLLFDAGKWHEPSKLVASLTNRMMKEGTKNLTAETIANRVEFYGASLKTKSGTDYASITLYTLSKHLGKLLPIVRSLLTDAVFPEKELATILRNSKQSAIISSQRNEYIADDVFSEKLYGEKHPYGYYVKPEDYDKVAIEQLWDFYKHHYTTNNCKLYIAGKIEKHHLQWVNDILGKETWKTGKPTTVKHTIEPLSTNRQLYIERPGTVQTAIRIGRRLFNKTHKDYAAFYVLNAILGGFFGSRLMSNIREDKGYTYSIYSTVVSLIRDGYLEISTEVGTDVWEKAVKEIFWEIDRLKTDLISDEELSLVRNYLLGHLLSNIDGIFNLAEIVQGLDMYGLSPNFYYELVETIKTISATEIRAYAQTYLDQKDFVQVVVG